MGARRFGLVGNTDLDAAEADQAVDALTDLMNNVGPVFREKDEAKKAEMKEKMMAETLPNWLKMMEAHLKKQGGNHFAGNQLTWADIVIYQNFDNLKRQIGQLNLTECPCLRKLFETVKNLPNIKKWE